MPDIKYIDLNEFRALGFLQEVNRLFFHPHGLALAVDVNTDDGDEVVGIAGIWDCRDDPEGVLYGPDQLDRKKVLRVAAERERHRETRAARFHADPAHPEADIQLVRR